MKRIRKTSSRKKACVIGGRKKGKTGVKKTVTKAGKTAKKASKKPEKRHPRRAKKKPPPRAFMPSDDNLDRIIFDIEDAVEEEE